MPFFKSAVEIDPRIRDGACLSRNDLSRRRTTRALGGRPSRAPIAFVSSASDREKFFIATAYDLDVTGNLERAQQSCDLWAQHVPRGGNRTDS